MDTKGASIAQVTRVGREVARIHASEVDEDARFPHECFNALREIGALGAAVPKDRGGGGADVGQLLEMCRVLGRHCSASSMILAMHHIQVLSIAHHCRGAQAWQGYLERVAREQRLIASVTSEVGPSGNLRESACSLEKSGETVTLTKQATTISYGAFADDLLLTARSNADAAPSEQAVLLAQRGDHTLRDVGSWNTLGMRGTCSPGATVECRCEPWQVLDTPFAVVAGETMVPTSHILWAGTWLGIAEDALATAGKLVREKARRTPGKTPSAARALERAARSTALFRDQVMGCASRYQLMVERQDTRAATLPAFVLAINELKLNASALVVDIVTSCMRAIGILAYKNDGPYTLGRHLRDAHSAALMINNDRLEDTNASLLLVHKGL